MNGEIEVVVATNAFGMGIDKANVRSVWRAIPTSVEAYYERAAQAATASRHGRVLLAMRSDLGAPDPLQPAARDRPGGCRGLRQRDADASDEGRLFIDPRPPMRTGSASPSPNASGRARSSRPGGGRLLVELGGSLDRRAVAAACAVAKDRGWRAYRAVEAFSFSDECRRRLLLDHFSGRAPLLGPLLRCCDPPDWLPDPASLPVPGRRRATRKAPRRPRFSCPARTPKQLRAWRAKAAARKPAYTVCPRRHPPRHRGGAAADPNGLREISGVGPTFVSRHADEVLAAVGRGPAWASYWRSDRSSGKNHVNVPPFLPAGRGRRGCRDRADLAAFTSSQR